MKWIRTIDGNIINLEQISVIYIEECLYDENPGTYAVVYILPSGNTFEEHFSTEQEAKNHMKKLWGIV